MLPLGLGINKPQPQKGLEGLKQHEEGPSVLENHQSLKNQNHYLTHFFCTGLIFSLFILLTFTSIYTIFITSASYNILNQNRNLLARLDDTILNTYLNQISILSSQSDDGNDLRTLTIPMIQQMSQQVNNRVIREVEQEKETPCPTPPPPEGQNKNPVAILHLQVGSEANYECTTLCLNPHINLAELTIDNENGKWSHNASTKKTAKHEVALMAIKELFPHLEDDLIYDQIDWKDKHCKVPAEYTERAKC